MTVFSRTERWWGVILLAIVCVVMSVGGATHNKEMLLISATAFYVMLWALEARIAMIKERLDERHLDIDARLPRTDLHWAATVILTTVCMTAFGAVIWESTFKPSLTPLLLEPRHMNIGEAAPITLIPSVVYILFWLSRFEQAVFRMESVSEPMQVSAPPAHSVPFTRRHGNG